MALESLSAAIYWLGEDGRILHVNASACRLTGYTSEALCSMYMTELNVDLDRDNWPAIWGLLKANKMRIFEARHRCADGQILQVEVEAHFLEWEGYEYSCAVIRDLSARIELESRLRHAERMESIGRLAGGVAHDFNNQLMGIIGYADLARNVVKDNVKALGFLDQLAQVVKVAADLTSQLLAFSRQGKFLVQPVDLHGLLAQIFPILARSLGGRIKIAQELAAERPFTLGDPSQLQSAILNLVLNARDAMPHGGTVTVATSNVEFDDSGFQPRPLGLAPGAYVVVQIRDTGMGVEKGLEAKIFEPFFSTKSTGTGLGLAAVYGTAKNHKGAVGMTSELGKGSAFTLYLPAARPGTVQRSLDGEPATLRLHGHVLVVDDDAVVREGMARMLEALGCSVASEPDGQSAVAYLREHRHEVDLVLLDLVMPGMSGRETFAAMQAIDPGVRVLIASGYSLDGEAQAMLESGARGFLQKPFGMSVLAGKVSSLLSGRADSTPESELSSV